jgi:DNA-binding transcriptional ArsR family regulator
MSAPSTLRVVIPLQVRRRNGRPRILPPDDHDAVDEAMPDPRTLRAIARAWDWRRRLERGEAATLGDIARAEGVTLPFVSRHIRLAYLAPVVLERLLVHRQPCALARDKLAAAALAPWAEQPDRVFDE